MVTPSRISREEAAKLVAGRTEKPGGVDPVLLLSERHPLFRARLPLDAFVANECGDRYDGTVDARRAAFYATRDPATAPPVIAATRHLHGKLHIGDGGHRISSARLRGDATIDTIYRVPVGHELHPGDDAEVEAERMR